MRGAVETRHAPRNVIAHEVPDAKTLRIMEIMENGGETNA